MYVDADGVRVLEDRKIPKDATDDDFVWSKMKFWDAAVPVNQKSLLEVIAYAAKRSEAAPELGIRNSELGKD